MVLCLISCFGVLVVRRRMPLLQTLISEASGTPWLLKKADAFLCALGECACSGATKEGVVNAMKALQDEVDKLDKGLEVTQRLMEVLKVRVVICSLLVTLTHNSITFWYYCSYSCR